MRQGLINIQSGMVLNLSMVGNNYEKGTTPGSIENCMGGGTVNKLVIGHGVGGLKKLITSN